MKPILLAACALSALVVGCSSGNSSAPEPTAQNGGNASGGGEFAKVGQIFGAKCMMCHGEGGKAGLDVRSYESVMKGSRNGPVVIAGDPDKSPIILSLKGVEGRERMPKNSMPLSDDEMKTIESWIKNGAKS